MRVVTPPMFITRAEITNKGTASKTNWLSKPITMVSTTSSSLMPFRRR